MVLVETLIFLSIIGFLVYIWCKYNYSYWERKGIPYDKPTFLIGNLKNVLLTRQSLGLNLSDIYKKPQFANDPVIGIYALHKPALIIKDPEIIKNIFIKDFNKFSSRYATVDFHSDKLGAYNLFFVKNPIWRELRTTLTPVFTSGKIKQMYPLMQDVGFNLERQLEKRAKDTGTFQCEVKEMSALFTTDLIATIAFGINTNSLENPNVEFREQGRKMMNFTTKKAMDGLAIFFMPKVAALVRSELFSKEYSKFLRDSVHYVMDERERSGTIRNDLIDILLSLKKQSLADKKSKVIAEDLDYLVAQAGLFYTAGFETSSSTLSFALYELARHPELQKRLREEIREALKDENSSSLSYEKINSLEYLNMVIDETMRLYPSLPFLDRVYKKIPGEANFSLRPFYDYELEDDTPVYIPAFAIQRDPKYWPNPDDFDPERFSPENKKTQNPMAFIPFGLGLRNCIGMRVGLLQVRMGLVHYLKNFYVRTCPETIDKMIFNPLQINLQSLKGLHLEFVKDTLY